MWQLEPTESSACGGSGIAHVTSDSALGWRMAIDTAGPASKGRGSAIPVGKVPVAMRRLTRNVEIEAIIQSTIDDEYVEDGAHDLIARVVECDIGDKLEPKDFQDDDGRVLSLFIDSDGKETAVDDIRGGPLCPSEVKKARREEIGYVLKRRVYRPARRSQCLDRTGRPPVATGWSDTNKGDAQQPNYRSRLVAKQFRRLGRDGREALFAATPPSECLRLVASIGVHMETDRRRMKGDGPIEFMILDVKRALLRAGPSGGLHHDAP